MTSLGFDRDVPSGGYAWWYVDAMSDDGRHALTIIAFIGSVFSPYYAFARRRGPSDPLHHCAVNVALYGASGKRWAMTERGRSAVSRDARQFRVGPSGIAWDGATLTIDIDEITNPIPSRLSGQVRVHPSAVMTDTYTLDDAGRHRWRPVAPCARIEAVFSRPDLRWSGDGYFDLNHGDAPLEQDFIGWNWSRAARPDGSTFVSYDTEARRGMDRSLALAFDPRGTVADLPPLTKHALRPTGWRISRTARADGDVRVVKTLEDAPFYARSHLAAEFNGSTTDIMHESLSLDRFRSPIVQAMLAFRMPRRRG